MIDLVFIALFQAAAGTPATTPPADTTQTQSTQQQQPATGQPTQNTAASDQNKVHCRMEREVGSRLGHRVCTTAAQDQELERDSRDMINRAQSQMGTSGN